MAPKATIKGTEDFKAFFIVEKYTKLCITHRWTIFVIVLVKIQQQQQKNNSNERCRNVSFFSCLNERDSDIIYAKSE